VSGIGLNVIEQWNGANDFVFFARRGELVSNRREDHEVSMLSLHLLQNCMVLYQHAHALADIGAAKVG
jgi:TnpA family transposase